MGFGYDGFATMRLGDAMSLMGRQLFLPELITPPEA